MNSTPIFFGHTCRRLIIHILIVIGTLAGQKKAKLVMSAIESYDIVGGGSTQTNVETAGEQPSKRIKCIHLISSTLMKRQMDMLNGSLVYKW